MIALVMALLAAPLTLEDYATLSKDDLIWSLMARSESDYIAAMTRKGLEK